MTRPVRIVQVFEALPTLRVSFFASLLAVTLVLWAAERATAQPVTAARPGVAVVLSGGGSRGGAHIGALRELERAGIPIDLVVGTSFGALVGGLYSAGYSTADLELILRSIEWNTLLSNQSRREYLDIAEKIRADRELADLRFENFELNLPIGLQAGQKIQQLFDRLTASDTLQAQGDFDRLAVPFRAVATDLLTGAAHVFRNGWLSTAIRSSAAIPGLFAPVRVDQTLLVDGAISGNVPSDVARSTGADMVIAIDVSPPLKSGIDEFKSLIDVLNQAIGFQVTDNTGRGRREADLVITPQIDDRGMMDFSEIASLVDTGAEAVRLALPEIQRLLAARTISTRPPGARANRLNSAVFDWERFDHTPAPIAVSEIRITGLERYPSSVVRDRLSLRPGDSVSTGSIDHDVSMLYGTGLFLDVKYALEREANNTVLTFDVTEKPPVQLGLGLRYDTSYQVSGAFDVLARGVPGALWELYVHGLLGNAKNFEFGLRRTRIARATVGGAVQFFSQPRSLYSGHTRVGDYQDQRYAAGAFLQYPLTNAARVQLLYTIARVHIERARLAGLKSDSTKLGRLRLGLEVDTLDDIDAPGSGLLAAASVDRHRRGLGSSADFDRYAARAKYYISAGDFALSVSANSGHLGADAPHFEQFFVGGGQAYGFSSVPFIGLGRDEVVAREFAMAGVELRYRVRRFQAGVAKGVYLSGIYDSGKFVQGTPLLFQEFVVHGAGVRLLLDVSYLGPVRLEIGRAGNRGTTTYFSIGPTF